MYISTSFSHLGFNINRISTCGFNITTYKQDNKKMSVMLSDADKHMFDGSMKCLKLPNKKMCDICNYNRKCFRQCGNCKHKICIECCKHNNNDYINSCPCCRYTLTEHSKMHKLLYYING